MEVGDTSLGNWTTSLRTKKKQQPHRCWPQVSSVVTRDQFGQAQKKRCFLYFFPYFGALLSGQGMDVDVKIVRSFSVNFNP